MDTGSPFRLIHGNQDRHDTDTEARENAAHDEERNRSSGSLHRDTDGKDETGSDDTQLTTKEIGNGSASQCTWTGGQYARVDG